VHAWNESGRQFLCKKARGHASGCPFGDPHARARAKDPGKSKPINALCKFATALLVLAFPTSKENNEVRWAWPFNSRGSGDRHKEGNRSPTRAAGPDFLCVGAHKAGTTWLYHQLESHPNFWMPPVKELHYLAQLSMVQRAAHPRCRDERDLRFLKRLKSLSAEPTIDLENYGRLFESKASLLSGDISTNYSTLSNEVIRQVVGYFPNLKVIFLARDPVERVWSHLSMEVHYRQIKPFDVTNIDEVNRNLLRRGCLAFVLSVVVARWKRHVHPKQFHVYFFDDPQSNLIELRRSILRFLGADPDKPGIDAGLQQLDADGKLQLTNE
jgi:hypothetical protein